MARQSFRVDQENFTVDFSKSQIQITERSRAVEVSINVDEKLAKWLVKKLKSLAVGEFRLGFLGSFKGENSDLMLNLRKNKGGLYLSMLWFSTSCSRGFKNICVPQGRLTEGWKGLLSAL